MVPALPAHPVVEQVELGRRRHRGEYQRIPGDVVPVEVLGGVFHCRPRGVSRAVGPAAFFEAAFLAAVFFAAAFLAGTFLAGSFLAAAFLAGAFLAPPVCRYGPTSGSSSTGHFFSVSRYSRRMPSMWAARLSTSQSSTETGGNTATSTV